MGIRSKLFWLYLLTFGLMASIATVLLLSFLQNKFLDLEASRAEQVMSQLLRNFETELSRLNELNTDWSNWDGMYYFAKDGGDNFLREEVGPGAMLSAQINLMAVIDTDGRILTQQAFDLAKQAELPVAQFTPALQALQGVLKQDSFSKACGLYNITHASLLLCWQPIRRTDQSGNYVGTLLMARVVGDIILERMRKQSSVDFDIRPIQSTSPIQAIQIPVDMQAPKLVLLPAGQNEVSAELVGLTGKPTVEIHMRLPDDISRNGNQVIRWVMSVMLLVVAINGGCLIIGVHLLLVRRLKSISSELKTISATTLWDKRITSIGGSDELNSLGEDVNQLLEVIGEQITSLESLTLTDPLTKIANRRAFDQRLAIEMDAFARSGLPLALLSLDVDYFKLYNDNYGHPAGDIALKILGSILRHTASRPTDLPARIGGEEFSILLPNTNLDGAVALANRLFEELRQRKIPHAYSPVDNYLTVSIGVTLAGNESLDSFLGRADNAVYQSKANGRNQLTILQPDLA